MKLLGLLALTILFSTLSLSQSPNNVQVLIKSKISSQTSKSFYLKNTSLSRHFIKRYVKLTKSFKRYELLKGKKNEGYRTKDTVVAYKQINGLQKVSQNTFYQLMQTRLEWDYEEHLQKKLLNSARLNLQNNIDSAFYIFILGIYHKDSLNEILARKLGFVKSDNKGNELVYWEKINSFKLQSWALMYFMDEPYQIDININHIRNTFLPYFEKAIELDKSEFFYMIEMLLPFIRLGDEKTVQEKIIQYKNNYSPSHQKWLEERMNESIARQKKVE